MSKLLLVLLTLIGGCTQFVEWIDAPNKQYLESVKQSSDALVAQWSAEDAAYRNEHNIKHRIDRWNDPLTLGMTTQEVYERWGMAMKDSESFSASGHLLVWKYGAEYGHFGTYFPADTYLYFLDNKLINIVKTR